MGRRSNSGLLVLIGLSCSAPAPTRPPAAPEKPARALPASVPSAHGSTAEPAASAVPSASPAPTASAPADPDEPHWKRRTRELHAAADRLTGGEIGRAEARCVEQGAPDQEACVDAALEQHGQKLAEDMARSFRMLELLQQYGESQCKGVRASKKKDCAYAAMEAFLVDLKSVCPSDDGDQQHQCFIARVLERLGP